MRDPIVVPVSDGQRFAIALAVRAERERCAQVCRDIAARKQALADKLWGEYNACDEIIEYTNDALQAEACAEAIEKGGT